MSRLSLLDYLSALDDPRQRGKVVYPLPEILLLVLCATLAGAEDLVEIRQWATGAGQFRGACCRSRRVSPRMTR